MKNIRNHALTCLTAMFLVIIFTSQIWATTIKNGIPFNTSINSMNYMNVDIVVPDGATGMTVSITNGSGDLDLYLKYGSPISGDNIVELHADADIISNDWGADETISITTASTPALRAGTWYAATLNRNTEPTSFTITATIYTVDYTVSFGPVKIGQATQKSTTITNSSTSDQIITAVNIVGLDAARFGATPNCPTIPAGGSHTIDITFQPISPGPASAQLIITSSGQMSSVLTIALTGTGTGTVTGEVLPLPTGKTNYPAYPPTITAETSMTPATCKPIGVGDVGTGGDTVAIEIKLKNPSGPYDAYLALQAPAIDPNEFFMLGQDGIFHPFSQSGLVKWKQAASGKIDEKPFGEFPVSLLPGGDYNFNFLLTAANSHDAHYLWQTSFFAPDTSTTVPDGSAGFFNGTLVVPNATILSGGQLYENSAPVSEDELTGIKKDGKVYLYHPAQEQAELSEENTRLAVAYFMTGLSTSEIKAVKEQMKRSASRSQAGVMPRSTTDAPPTLNRLGETVTLGTGVKITLQNGDGIIKAKNNRRRFSIVKTGETKGKRYLLLPRASTIPTDLLDFVNYWELGGEIRDDILAFDKIETFGAFFRISHKTWWGELDKNQSEAVKKDLPLMIKLNCLDMSYFILEGIRQGVDLAIPTTCASIAINAIARSVEVEIADLLSGDEHAVWTLKESALQKVSSDLIECATQALALTTVVGALWIEIADMFVSAISNLQWVLEDNFYEAWLTYFGRADAYDLAILPPNNPNEMIAYLGVDKNKKVATEMVLNLFNRDSWIGFETENFFSNRPLGITPGGVVLSYREVDGSRQLITTTDWGTRPSTNIGDTCDLSVDTSFAGVKAALTNAGDLFFAAEKRWKDKNNKTVYRRGICKGCNFVDIVLDKIEKQYVGYDNITISALDVSRDGKVLVFCAFDDVQYRLYVMDLPGGNPRAIFTSYNPIISIHLSSTGDKILFSYSPKGSDVFSSEPCVISLNGSNMIQLSTPSMGGEYVPESAAISPDGNWIAIPEYIHDDTFFKDGVAFIRSDGSEYHFVHCKDVKSDPLSFLANGKSVIFCGQVTHYNEKEKKTYYLNDLFLVDVDKDKPDVRNITKTPEISETAPVVLLQ